MARLDEEINPSDLPPLEDFSALPNGEYEVEIVDSTNEDNSKRTGKIAKFEYVVISGEFNGRRLWSQHNYKHQNETAQRIGQQELGAIAAAVGHRGPIGDTADFHRIPLFVKAIYVPPSGQFKEKNEIKKWMPVDDSGTTQPQRPAPRRDAGQQQARQPAQNTQQLQPAGSGAQGARPWRGGAGGGQ